MHCKFYIVCLFRVARLNFGRRQSKEFDKWFGLMIKSSRLEESPLQPASRSENDKRTEHFISTLTSSDIYEQSVGVLTTPFVASWRGFRCH
jgi:hypothetical protein